MASEATVLHVFGRALWDPRPTRTDRRARQLAVALGYPTSWRVVRTIVVVNHTHNPTTKPLPPSPSPPPSLPPQPAVGHPHAATDPNQTQDQTTKESMLAEKETVFNDLPADPPPKKTKDEKEEQDPNSLRSSFPHKEPAVLPSSTADSGGNASTILPTAVVEPNVLIVDRIYAGKPGTGCDMWYHHAAAMQAAATWNEPLDVDEANDDNEGDETRPVPVVGPDGTPLPISTPYDHHGGHLLPRQPLFQKGDKVQVYYDHEWWDAKITRRKTLAAAGASGRDHAPGFVYSVQYSADNSKQSGVAENWIRPRPEAADAKQQALDLGLGPGWTAVSSGSNRWTITAPDGVVFTSKKKALAAYENQTTWTGGTNAAVAAAAAVAASQGDPPWRTTGNVYLGRKVFWTTLHQASARRTVAIDQIGTVVGWISETDVDSAGQPGFRSEKSGQPARLYNVVFEDDPNHPYAYHLLQCQDLEEDELLEALIPLDDDVKPPRNNNNHPKKPRQR